MGSYGVFTYGMNKCKTIQSNNKNLFHTGILSNEFKELIEMEEKCRKFEKGYRGDIYVSDVLYKAFMFRWRKLFKRSRAPVSFLSSGEGSTPYENITYMKIPETPLIYENHNRNTQL